MLHAWVLFVALAAFMAAGHGFLVRAVAPRSVDGVLLLPVGLAAFVAVAQIPTGIPSLAPLVTPLAVVLGVLGWALGLLRRPRLGRPDLPAVLACTAAFGVLAAPVVLSGEATFPGYTVQGDTTVHLMGAAALPEYGRDFADLPPSSYSQKLETYFSLTSYPSGGAVALGVLSRVAAVDPAWTLSPMLALLGAALGLAAVALLRTLGAGRWTSAVGGGLAALPALFYGFVHTGQLKEVGAAMCIVLTAAAVVRWLDVRGLRDVLPVVVATAAALAFLGLVAVAWLGPLLLIALVVAVARHGARAGLAAAGVVAVGVAVLAFQTLGEALTYVRVTQGVLTNAEDFGNLLKPLNSWQVVGVWLQGEWRLDPEGATNLYRTGIGIGVVVVAVALGLLDAVRRRALLAIAIAGGAALAAVVLTGRGSAYADAKVLAITSPLVLAGAGLGFAALVRAGRRPESAVLAAAVSGLVLLSAAHAYHAANLAPRERLEELEVIGERLAGDGPVLVPDWDETAHHFLREATPEGPNEPYAPRRPRINERSSDVLGSAASPVSFAGNPGESADLDGFGERYLGLFRHIVVRRRPSVSRPSSMFVRTRRGRVYDVWTLRPERRSRLVAHLPVGHAGEPVGRARCSVLRRMARAVRRDGQLVAAIRAPAVRVPVVSGPRPGYWTPGDRPDTLRPREAGQLTRAFALPRTRTYAVWVEGSFGRAITVEVDGRRVGTLRHHLNFGGVELQAGSVRLERGPHAVRLSSARATLHPGDGGYVRRLGPISFASDEWGRLVSVTPENWRQLCGRADVDWVEALR